MPVAVVTGSSRGVGRGIALSLGDAGFAVYVTGRSSRAGMRTEDLPGTVEDTAEEVTARGGTGIPFAGDLRDSAIVETLFARVQAEQGGLDLLVNNVWAGYENQPHGLPMRPFWELDPALWENTVAGVRMHLEVSRAAAPLLIARGRGLVVTTIARCEGKYLLNLYYDLAKEAARRAAYGMALELRKHQVASLALAPGFVRSERVMAAHAQHPFDLSATESPEYIGRAVAALAADPNVMAKTGGVFAAGEIAREYGFTDTDGRQPPPFVMPEGITLD